MTGTNQNFPKTPSSRPQILIEFNYAII
jgi:hypothetical protein